MTTITNFLKDGAKGTEEFRKEFGKYPRKDLHLLMESGVVEKFYEDRRVMWQLKELPKEDRLDEIDEGLEKSNELLSIYPPDPITPVKKSWFKKLIGK